MEGETPQLYWKAHATWKHDDQAMQAKRAKMQSFVEMWTKKMQPVLTANASMNPENSTKKFSRRLRRGMTNTGSFAGLEFIEGFVNISLNPIGIRKIGSLGDEHKTGEVIEPGEAVIIDKILEQDNIRFLRLFDGRGWVFDSKGGEAVIMAKMEEVEVGDSWYRMMCKEMVDIRRTPIYDQAAKTSQLLCPKELVVVNAKCRVRGYTFVHIADGRGWVFLVKPGAKKKERSLTDTVMEECDQEVTQGEAFLTQDEILPVTNEIVEVGLWTYYVSAANLTAIGVKIHGVVLNEGDVIKVDKRAYSDGCAPEKGEGAMRWLRLMDGRGWVPEKQLDGKAAVVLQSGGAVSYPSTLKKKYDKEKPPPSWSVGIV